MQSSFGRRQRQVRANRVRAFGSPSISSPRVSGWRRTAHGNAGRSVRPPSSAVAPRRSARDRRPGASPRPRSIGGRCASPAGGRAGCRSRSAGRSRPRSPASRPQRGSTADRAERLRRPLVGLVRPDELVSGEQADRLGWDASVGRADAAGDLLAGRTVAEGHAQKVVRKLELDTPALAASAQCRHGPSLASQARMLRSCEAGNPPGNSERIAHIQLSSQEAL
jgi:hypothetical protein